MDETMETLGAISQIVVRCHLLLYVSCIHDHDFQLNLITLLIKHVSTADGPWQSDWCKVRPGAGESGTGLVWAGRSASWAVCPAHETDTFCLD